MDRHAKKKIEIIVERPLLGEVLAIVDGLGAKGYSVLPLIAGRGEREAWGADDLSGAFDRVMVIVIADEPVAARLADEAFTLLRPYNAILYISDVAVMRQHRF